MQRILIKILGSLLAVLFVVAAVTVGAVAATTRVRDGAWRMPSQDDVRELVNEVIVVREPEPSKVIYLQRNALTVVGGRDSAKALRSSLIQDGETHTVPRYRVSNATWNRLVTCVQSKFDAYDVVVTDQKPESGSYILVKVGGRPADIGMDGQPLGGIAPFNGHAIPDSIVFAFDQGGQFRTKNNCETAAHEVGHVFGLDHTFECKDLMSYKHGCGKKVFVAEPMPCGEHEVRPCEDLGDEQNSAGHLQGLLGTMPEESAL